MVGRRVIQGFSKPTKEQLQADWEGGYADAAEGINSPPPTKRLKVYGPDVGRLLPIEGAHERVAAYEQGQAAYKAKHKRP